MAFDADGKRGEGSAYPAAAAVGSGLAEVPGERSVQYHLSPMLGPQAPGAPRCRGLRAVATVTEDAKIVPVGGGDGVDSQQALFQVWRIARYNFLQSVGARAPRGLASEAIIIKFPEGWTIEAMAKASKALETISGKPVLIEALSNGAAWVFGMTVATTGYLPLTLGTGFKVGMFDPPHEAKEVANTAVGYTVASCSAGVSFTINGVINQGTVGEFITGNVGALALATRGEIAPFEPCTLPRSFIRFGLGGGALLLAGANALPYARAVDDTLGLVSDNTLWRNFNHALYPINLATRWVLVYRSVDNALSWALNLQCGEQVSRVHLLADNAQRVVDDLVLRSDIRALKQTLDKFVAARLTDTRADDTCWIELLDSFAKDYTAGGVIRRSGAAPDSTLVKRDLPGLCENFTKWLGFEGLSPGQKAVAGLLMAASVWADIEYALVQIPATQKGLAGFFGKSDAWPVVADIGAAVNLMFYVDWSKGGILDFVRFAGAHSIGASFLTFLMVASSSVPGTALSLDNPDASVGQTAGSTFAAATMNGKPACYIAETLGRWSDVRVARGHFSGDTLAEHDQHEEAKLIAARLGAALKQVIQLARERLTSAYLPKAVAAKRDSVLVNLGLTGFADAREGYHTVEGGEPLSLGCCCGRPKAFRNPEITTMLRQMQAAMNGLELSDVETGRGRGLADDPDFDGSLQDAAPVFPPELSLGRPAAGRDDASAALMGTAVRSSVGGPARARRDNSCCAWFTCAGMAAFLCGEPALDVEA